MSSLLPSSHLLLFLLASACCCVFSATFPVLAIAASPMMLAECHNCLGYEMVGGAATWDPAVCSARSFEGVAGEISIVRSAEANALVNSMLNGRGTGLLGCSGIATDGALWQWNTTAEIVFDNTTRSAARFAFDAFTRNASNTSQYFQPDASSAGRVVVETSGDDWTSTQVTGSSRSVICSYHLPVVQQLLHTNISDVQEGGANAAQEQLFTHVADFQVVPEHVTHDVAYQRCLSLTRVDPNTGDSVRGALAVLLFENETNTVADIVRQRKSDVLFHSNDTGFGLWLGANVTKGGGPPGSDTVVWSDGGADGGERFVGKNAGVCTEFMFCGDFAANQDATLASEGLMMRLHHPAFKLQPQDPALAMPFACEFRFKPNKTIAAPSLAADLTRRNVTTTMSEQQEGGGNNNNITTAPPAWQAPLSVPDVSVFVARYNHEWKTFSDAKSACEAAVAQNEVGDAATGELATAVNAAELAVLRKLVVGSRVPELAPNAQSDFGGAWIGLSNSASSPGFADAAALSDQLYWSQGAAPPWSYKAFQSPSTCQDFSACNAVRLTAHAGASHAAITFNGLSQSGFAAVSTAATNKRPYLCTFRFPLRANITNYLAVELYSAPRSFQAASELCEGRTLTTTGPGGAPFRASLGKLPEAAYSRVAQFLSSARRNPFGRSRVYVGSRTASDRCLTHLDGAFTFSDCSTPRPFVCLFSVPGSSRTLSKSNSFNDNKTRSASATPTATQQLSDESPTMSRSHAVTPSRTKQPTPTVPPPTTTALATNMTTTTTTATTTSAAPRPRTITHELTETAMPDPTSPPALIQASKDVSVTSSVIAVASGTGVVAVQQARLNLAQVLASCGTGDTLGEEPGLMESPFKFKLGPDDKFSYSRGMMVGNPLVILIVTAGMLLLAVFYAALTQQPIMRGILRCRMPGALSIPFAILLPPTAQHVIILWANGIGGADVGYGILGFLLMLVLPVAGTIWCALLVKRGRLTLFFNDGEEPTLFAQNHPEFAKTYLYLSFCYATESLFEYRDTPATEGDEVIPTLKSIDAEMTEQKTSGGGGGGENDGSDALNDPLLSPLDGGESPATPPLDSPKTQQQQQQQQQDEEPLLLDNIDDPTFGGRAPKYTPGMRVRRAPIKSYKHVPSEAAMTLLAENPLFSMYGVVYEDYARWEASILEVLVSTILGMSAGGASGKVDVGSCITFGIINILVSLAHAGHILYFRGINPRLVFFFLACSSVINFVAIVLSFVKYLLSKFSFEDAFASLSIVQSGLGLATAILGFIGFVNFVYQMWDAFYLRSAGASAAIANAQHRAAGVSKPETLDLLDIEKELAAIEAEQERAVKDAEQQRAAAAAEEEERKRREHEAELAEARRREAETAAAAERERMNRMLEQADAAPAGTTTKYELDDGELHGDADEADPLKRKLRVGRNAELEARQAELAQFLGGAGAASSSASVTLQDDPEEI